MGQFLGSVKYNDFEQDWIFKCFMTNTIGLTWGYLSQFGIQSRLHNFSPYPSASTVHKLIDPNCWYTQLGSKFLTQTSSSKPDGFHQPHVNFSVPTFLAIARLCRSSWLKLKNDHFRGTVNFRTVCVCLSWFCSPFINSLLLIGHGIFLPITSKWIKSDCPVHGCVVGH